MNSRRNYTLEELVESDQNELREHGWFRINVWWVFVVVSGLFYLLIFCAGFWLAGKHMDARVKARMEERLTTYENYMIAEQRGRDERVSRHAVLLDSLFVECDVNRACWVSLAKKVNGMRQ